MSATEKPITVSQKTPLFHKNFHALRTHYRWRLGHTALADEPGGLA
jgi:hypothetical protein